MFDDFKSLLRWAEFGVSTDSQLSSVRLVHETPDETLKRVIKLAVELICGYCRGSGYGMIGGVCRDCKGTGKKKLHEVPT